MPRYLPPADSVSKADALPLDTLVVIIPRQSKKAGAKNNIHSQELADHELLALATAHGFAAEQVRIDKRDMGISANTTTIDDRPALREWLRELLPSGMSKVVIFSQEDRAFRDEEEIELNTFIREVKRHHGWVICGHKVYRMWEEYDADMFRMMCKYAAKYIVHHVRGRLHPAAARAAQRGYYDGRNLNIGYIVDYDPKSPTYKRYIPYEPHAELVLQEIFERFARMPYPSVPALVRYWNESNGMEPVIDPTTGELRIVPRLYFPMLPSDIDERVIRRQTWGRREVFPPYGIDDPLRRGWLLHEQSARRILSNIFYIGWVARGGQIVRGEVLDTGQVRIDPSAEPLVLHEPLVKDSELFWFCFNRVSAYTVDGQRNPKRKFYTSGPRQKYNDDALATVNDPWPTTVRNAETNTLLLLGKVRCGIHHQTFMRFRRHAHEADRYVCKAYDPILGHRQRSCAYLQGQDIDRAVVAAFLRQLELTEDDVKGIARAWQMSQRRVQLEALRPASRASRVQDIENELANLVTGVGIATSELVRERLVKQMEALTAELGLLRQQEQEFQQEADGLSHIPLSPGDWQFARRAASMLDTLRTKWDLASLSSRQALMQWIVESVVVTPVEHDRRQLDGMIVWRGGAVTFILIVRSFDRRQVWDERELEVMRSWYPKAMWEDLQSLLPGRTRESMVMAAHRLGLPQRPRHTTYWQPIPEHEKIRLAAPLSPHRNTSSRVMSSEATLTGSTLVELVSLLGS